MAESRKKRAKVNKACLLLERMPNMLILHQLAPFVDFTKLSLLSRANKQLHQLLGFLFDERLYFIGNETECRNIGKVYFSRINWMRLFKGLTDRILHQIEYFSNIQVLDITKDWKYFNSWIYSRFYGTLIISMNSTEQQIREHLAFFPNTSELVVLGSHLPKKDAVRVKKKDDCIRYVFQSTKLQSTIKHLKILAKEQHDFYSPTKSMLGLLTEQHHLQTIEFDYPIRQSGGGFSFLLKHAFPNVAKVIEPFHIFKKEGGKWYKAFKKDPEVFVALELSWYDKYLHEMYDL